jgi:DNA-directed RNA polymerase subunit RPC12/RpoP
MELRCHNCGERIHVDAAKTGQEIECPKCGVTMVLPAQHVVRPGRYGPATGEGEARPTQRTMKRIFDPIPRPAAYLAGVVFILVILSPFWIYLFQERFERRRILLSPDVSTNGIPQITTETNVDEPVLEVARNEPTVALDQYRGVRLDAAREDLQRRFSLRLQNTRGMVPEIYEASKVGDIEQMTAHFYNNALKEFFLLMRQQRAIPDAIEKELRDELGEPKERSEQTNTTATAAIGTGLSGTLGVPGSRDETGSKLAGLSHQRYLAWNNERNRIDATIYYSSPDPAQCTSMLAVHVSATQWLDANRSRLSAVVPPPDLLERSNAARPEAEPPKRLFP